VREEPQECSACASLDTGSSPLRASLGAAVVTAFYTALVTTPVFPVVTSVKRELPNNYDCGAGHKPGPFDGESYGANHVFEAPRYLI
jgi:hypothetical protein